MLSDNEVKIKFDKLSNKLQAGQFNEVINETLTLLKKRQHQVFFNILSIAYQSIGEFQKSSDVMEDALRMNPNNPFFLNNMGISQHKLENFNKAEEYFNRGLKIAPNYINILNNLGNLKKDLNFTNEAIESYKKSISIKNDVLETHLNLANCYQSLGKYENAIEHYERVLEINPKFTVADRLISKIKKYKENDVHLEGMEIKLKDINLSEDQLSHLYFGLGKAHEDIKNLEKSFMHYQNGNKILNKKIKFNINSEKNDFLKIKDFFLKKNIKKITQSSRKFIFIIGMPRSGTSLIEQILSSHRNVYGGGELPFLSKIINNKYFSDYDIVKLNKNNEVDSFMSNAFDEYVDKISALDNSKKDFTDKSPLNFRYVGFIKYIFQNSKIINCKRNPTDIAWSNYKNFFPDTLPFTNNLNDLGNYYNLYEDYMKYWKIDFAKDIYDIQYENLVDEPKNEIEKLLKFCNLDWDENCMHHEKNNRSIKTASAPQARHPIYKSAVKSSNLYKDYIEDFLKTIND